MNIRYLLCNADEMEPNTYKDRLLMEQLPHLLIEGMIISARALKAYRGYIFLRGEYVDAAIHLRRAVEEAKAAGLLGKNILGSGFDFELFVHTGAGRYICGEETALINSWKGAAPTRGPNPLPRRFRCLGQTHLRQQRRDPVQRARHHRQRCFLVSGTGAAGVGGSRHQADGLLRQGEQPRSLGAAVRHHSPRAVRGVRRRHEARLSPQGVATGGAGTGFLLPEHLDAQMYAGGIGKVGTRMGTGLAMAVDDSINMVGLLRNMEEFFARESCGWCTPCRDGLPWSVKILRALERGEGQPEDPPPWSSWSASWGQARPSVPMPPAPSSPLAVP